MRIKIGAIVEILTAKGLAYAQYTHKHEDYGYLIRVFEGFYESKSDNLQELANKQYTFSAFLPLGAVVRRKIFPIIGHASIAQHGEKFPLFKTGFVHPETNKVENWFL